jgi:hypothetical protein
MYREAYPDAAVFWVYAGNANRIRESYATIARSLELQSDVESAFALVQRYLSDSRNGSWLIVIDNADDSELVMGHDDDNEIGDGGNILHDLPQTTGCTVLATTRDERIAYDVTGGLSEPIRVDVMSPQNALLLLESKVPNPRLRPADDATAIVDELGFLPLAVSHAAAYMTKYRVNAKQYLEFLRDEPSQLLAGTNRKGVTSDLFREKDQSVAVYASLGVSLKQLERENTLACIILSVMACLDTQSISRLIIQAIVAKKVGSNRHLWESLGLLVALSLITENSEGETYSMHKLVVGAVRAWDVSHLSMPHPPTLASVVIIELVPDAEMVERRAGATPMLDNIYPHLLALLDSQLRQILEPVLGTRLIALAAKISFFKIFDNRPAIEIDDLLRSFSILRKNDCIEEAIFVGLFICDYHSDAVKTRLLDSFLETFVQLWLDSKLELLRTPYLTVVATGDIAVAMQIISRENGIKAQRLVNQLHQSFHHLAESVDTNRDYISCLAQLNSWESVLTSYQYLLWEAAPADSSADSEEDARTMSDACASALCFAREALLRLEPLSLDDDRILPIVDAWWKGLKALAVSASVDRSFERAVHACEHTVCLSGNILMKPFESMIFDEYVGAVELAGEQPETIESLRAKHAECAFAFSGCRYFVRGEARSRKDSGDMAEREAKVLKNKGELEDSSDRGGSRGGLNGTQVGQVKSSSEKISADSKTIRLHRRTM